MEIKRDLYLNKLIQSMHSGLIKVITGLRRSGKSYILFHLFKNYLISIGVKNDHIIEINYDDFKNEDLRNPYKTYEFLEQSIKDNEMYYILLDEIQLLDRFESVLNGIMRKENADIYVTGSNAKFLSKDVITEFRGRGMQIYIQPLTFKEFYDSRNLSFEEAYLEYTTYGGMPYLYNLKTAKQKADYLKSLFIETYIKDIVQRNHLPNDISISKLLDTISSSIGSFCSPTKLENTFKTELNYVYSHITIQKHLELLEDSFLISKLDRFDVKGKKYISTNSKYYFTDLGLRNSRLNFRQLEQTHLMENLIYNELISRGYNIDVGVTEILERKSKNNYIRKQLEVDFVINNMDNRIYVQTALSIPDREKYNQERKSLINIPDSFLKIIITKDNVLKHYTDDGILIISLKDFLLGDQLFW